MFIPQSKKKAKTELPELEAASSATAALLSVANQVSHSRNTASDSIKSV